MKKLALFLVAIMAVVACKKETHNTESHMHTSDVEVEKFTKTYPEPISKIFDAHGGMDKWYNMQGLYFGIDRGEYVEKHVVNLKNRKSVIEYDHHLLGFDGENVWLKNLDTTTYKSDPKFYYNLMFYFYAMPFVFGDDGVVYSEGPELEVGDNTYPGILISYEDGVGESSQDEYILFYEPETYQMQWLAYTVTFFSKEKAKKFNLIKYADWADVGDFKLPTTLQWHHFVDGEVGDMRNEMKFVSPKISNNAPEEQLFAVPEGASIAE